MNTICAYCGAPDPEAIRAVKDPHLGDYYWCAGCGNLCVFSQNGLRKATKSELEVRGHFVLYVVYIRADGAPFADDDPNPKVIVYDMLQKYLRDHVMGDWAIDKADLTPSAKP